MRYGILGGLFLLGTAVVGDGGEVFRVAVYRLCAPRTPRVRLDDEISTSATH